MRILYINVNCKHSSTGKIVYDLYSLSNAAGHEAAVCYGRGPQISEPGIFKFGLDWETNFHAFMTRLSGLTGCWSFFATHRLLRFIDEFQPDVVHLHELHGYFVNLRTLCDFLAKRNIPVVYTFHCEFAYTGKCGHAYECEKWKTGCGNCPQVRYYPKSLFLDFTKQMFRQKQKLWALLPRLVITTPSKWLADRVRCSFLKDQDIRIVYNGIDTQQVFYPRQTKDLRAEHGLTDEKIVLAVAPKLMGEKKGGKWIVQLARQMKNENVKFIMVGVDDTDEVFPDNVITIGKTTNQVKLAEYYSLADCFVICSDKETFSMTCAESLCCGTPIAGFCAGAPETVFPTPQALFVPFGDLQSLKNCVKIQLDKGFDRSELANSMQLLYSREKMYRQFMEVYKELTNEVTR